MQPMSPQDMKALLELLELSRGEIVHVPEPRKTLRDEFAMAALIGYCNGSDVIGDPEFYARECYKIANAMMAERARQAKGESA